MSTLLKICEGRLPLYWDITPWFYLIDELVIVCKRDNLTRKRVIWKVNLANQTIFKSETIYNLLLGGNRHQLILGRIADARSHLELSRMARLSLEDLTTEENMGKPVLIEKYKIPRVNERNFSSAKLGTKMIDFNTMSIVPVEKRTDGWDLGSNLRIENFVDLLVCLNSSGEKLWSKNDLLGSWYQGVIGDKIYFLTPADEIVILDKLSGVTTLRVPLHKLKKVSNKVGGLFDNYNDLSFDSCTIYDVMVFEDQIFWLTKDNSLVISNGSGEDSIFPLQYSNELFLAAINKDFILLLAIENDDFGSLVVVKWRELQRGTNYIK